MTTARPLRVLHYNWTDPDDPARRGGGVRGYMQGLTRALAALPGCEVTTLASGLAHDLRGRPARWRQLRPTHYEIVNARPLAPSQADFVSPAQLSHTPTEAAFRDVLTRTGPYDIVHFHTLEGLPAQALAIAAESARVVLSLHNYHVLCPQVNLWWREQAHCTDNDGGARCATCLPLIPNPAAVRRAYQVETLLARFGVGPGHWPHDRLLRPALQRGWRAAKWLAGRSRTQNATPTTPPPPPLRGRRAQMVALINAHCAQVLAVSNRTADIARAHGIRRVATQYIGTTHAPVWARSQPRPWPARFTAARPLRLTYLGYMRRDKGFAFLLDALAGLPREVAQRVHLQVAARRGPPEMMAGINALRARLAGLDWQDGYTHARLDAVLRDTDLGVVPVLWEDNLPQTALEMHARRIPLLTSDRGGASELGGSAVLTFRAGDAADFARSLGAVLAGDVCLARYWAQARAPQDMAQHARQLCEIYAQLIEGKPDEGPDPYRPAEDRHLVHSGVLADQPQAAGGSGGALRAL